MSDWSVLKYVNCHGMLSYHFVFICTIPSIMHKIMLMSSLCVRSLLLPPKEPEGGAPSLLCPPVWTQHSEKSTSRHVFSRCCFCLCWFPSAQLLSFSQTPGSSWRSQQLLTSPLGCQQKPVAAGWRTVDKMIRAMTDWFFTVGIRTYIKKVINKKTSLWRENMTAVT